MHRHLCNNQQYVGNIMENVYAEIGEIAGMGYHVDDVQMMQRVKSQLMTSQESHTK